MTMTPFVMILVPMAVKSFLVAAVTLGVLRLAARHSAAVRSAIAHLGICALIALPFAATMLPSLPVSVPERLVVAASQASMPVLMAPAAIPLASSLPVAGPSPARGAGTFVLYAYLAPAMLLLLVMCAALFKLFRVRASARPVTDAGWRAAFVRAQSRMGVTRGTTLLVGGAMSSPISWGVLRPTILLNEEILAAKGQAEAILAHELAHVMQHDWAKLILARVTTTLFWFNPLAWLLACEAHNLREEAADDAVLAAGIGGPDYAALLIEVARSEARGALSTVHAVAPPRSALYRRITRVLDDEVVRAVPGRNQLAAFMAAALTVAAPLATVRFAPVAAPVSPVSNVQHGAASVVVAAAPAITPAIALDPAPPHSRPVVAAAPVKKPVPAAVAARSKPSPAPAPTQPAVLQQRAGLDQYPQMLRGELDAECFHNGGSPGPSPNLFQTADFNGDGIPDIVFDRTNYECRGATVGPGRYGTTLTIFVGGPSHSVAEVYIGSFYGSRVEYHGDGTASLIVADAATCAASGAATDWEACGHQVVLAAPAQGGGPEPAADRAEDR